MTRGQYLFLNWHAPFLNWYALAHLGTWIASLGACLFYVSCFGMPLNPLGNLDRRSGGMPILRFAFWHAPKLTRELG